MKVRELSIEWPPKRSAFAKADIKVDLDDVVKTASKLSGKQVGITLVISKGRELYGANLLLPARIALELAAKLPAKLPLTLREVGDLKI